MTEELGKISKELKADETYIMYGDNLAYKRSYSGGKFILTELNSINVITGTDRENEPDIMVNGRNLTESIIRLTEKIANLKEEIETAKMIKALPVIVSKKYDGDECIIRITDDSREDSKSYFFTYNTKSSPDIYRIIIHLLEYLGKNVEEVKWI